MSIKYTIGQHVDERTFVTFEGEASHPEAAREAVAELLKGVTTEVSLAEQAPPVSAGQIPYIGGGMPPEVAGKQVKAYLRGGPGCGWHGDTRPAEEWDWDIEGFCGDIVAYEVVEPVTEEPTEEPAKVPGVFTVGDRVVFNRKYGPAKLGDTGTVTGVRPDLRFARIPNDQLLVSVQMDRSGSIVTAYAFRLDHLKEQPKLRVGARIRIVRAESAHGYGNGDEFTVSTVSSTQGAFFDIDPVTRGYAYRREFEVIG